jgi:hypothetical protein
VTSEKKRKCQVCSDKLSGRQRKYCSNECSYRADNLKTRYGLTSTQVVNMYRKQSGRCNICDLPIDIHELGFTEHAAACIDHLHGSTHVRGLLCAECNKGLGMFKDSRKLLKSAIEYLTRTYKKD